MAGLPGRGARSAIPFDNGEALLIDESYNANPASMGAALKTLGDEPVERRIAVLGAMGELGDKSETFHAGLAGPITDARVDLIVLVGEPMKVLADTLGNTIDLVHVPDAAAALATLEGEIRAGDAVLVKGSNYLGLARLVEALASGKTLCST
jgi:UDP-N-acetylmuramoyl-tripeptide--D-alanyl-D-alanine ligase